MKLFIYFEQAPAPQSYFNSNNFATYEHQLAEIPTPDFHNFKDPTADTYPSFHQFDVNVRKAGKRRLDLTSKRRRILRRRRRRKYRQPQPEILMSSRIDNVSAA